MAHRIDTRLQKHSSANMTMKVCQGVLRVLPHAKRVSTATALTSLVEELVPGAPPDVLVRARSLAEDQTAAAVLKVFNSLDAEDGVSTVWFGVKAAMSFVVSRKKTKAGAAAGGAPAPAPAQPDPAGAEGGAPAGEPSPADAAPAQRSIWDERQAADATLKALALAHVARLMFPGDIEQRYRALGQSNAGRALLSLFGAVEVALPFLGDAIHKDGLLAMVIDEHIEEQAKRMGRMASKEDIDAARQELPYLVTLLDNLADASTSHVEAVAKGLLKRFTKAKDVTETIGDVAAAGFDVLPLYRCMSSHLVAEAAVWQAGMEAGLVQESAEATAWLDRFLPLDVPQIHDEPEEPPEELEAPQAELGEEPQPAEEAPAPPIPAPAEAAPAPPIPQPTPAPPIPQPAAPAPAPPIPQPAEAAPAPPVPQPSAPAVGGGLPGFPVPPPASPEPPVPAPSAGGGLPGFPVPPPASAEPEVPAPSSGGGLPGFPAPPPSPPEPEVPVPSAGGGLPGFPVPPPSSPEPEPPSSPLPGFPVPPPSSPAPEPARSPLPGFPVPPPTPEASPSPLPGFPAPPPAPESAPAPEPPEPEAPNPFLEAWGKKSDK